MSEEEFYRPYRDIAQLRARARDLLGVSEDAGADEIRRAFHALALRGHPDVTGGAGNFANLVNAYLVLTRPDPRGFPLESAAGSSLPSMDSEEYLAWWKKRFGP